MFFNRKMLMLAISSALVSYLPTSQAASRVGMGFTGGTSGEQFPDYANTRTIPYESVTALHYDVNFSNANTPNGNAGALGVGTTGGIIRYISPSGLNPNDTITFTFNNAKWMNGDARLCAEEKGDTGTTPQAFLGGDQNFGGAGGAGADVIEAASQFGNTFDTSTGISSVKLRINSGISLPTGATLALIAGNCSNTGGILTAGTNFPTLRIPANLSENATVSVTVELKDQNGTALASNSSATLFDIARQITFSVTNTEVAKIDVSTDRKKFLVQGQTTATTTTSKIAFGAPTTNPVEDKRTFAGSSKLTLNVVPTTNLDAVSTTGNTITGGNNNFTSTFTATNGKLVTTLDATKLNALSTSNSGTDSITITLTGLNAVDERDWYIDGQITLDPEGIVNITQPTLTHQWRTNGTVLIAPFFTNVTGYSSRFYLSNTGNTDAPFSIILQTDPAASPTPSITVSTGTILANSSLMIGGNGLDMGLAGQRGTLIFNISASPSNINGVYNQRNATDGSFDGYVMVKQ